MTLTQITEKGIKDGEIVNADINASAAIAKSKLASLDIVNGDINASAAIAGTKISPDFGSQNIVTTGTLGANNTTITGSGTNALEINGTGSHELYSYHDSGGVGWATGTGGSYGELLYLDESNSAIELFTGGTKRLTVNSSGNVGIGETSPANLFHVKVSDTGVSPHASAQIVLERAGTNYLQFLTTNTGTSGILFGDGDDADVAQIKYDHNIPAMQFVTETAERMRIDSNVNISSGNLQIGGTNVLNNSRTLYNLESIELADDKQTIFGDSGDLRIYHESGTSHIQDNVSNTLRISADSIALQSGDKSEAGLVFAKNRNQ